MDLENSIDNFVAKIRLGIDFFQEAGAVLVKMLDIDPHCFEQIIRQTRTTGNAWITLDVLKTFEQIGRKTLAVDAMFLPRHVLDRMLEMPVQTQVAIASKQVRVISGLRQGRHHETKKHLSDLTRREAPVVLGPSGVRSVAEQKKILNADNPPKRLGRFTIIVMNGKPFIRHSTKTGYSAKLVLDDKNECEVEIHTAV